MSLSERELSLLFDLLSRPTAPFRETHVASWAQAALAAAGVPCFPDPVGNLVVGAASPADYRRRLRVRDAEPVRMFIAHMDHPGFHGLRWLGADRLAVQWHGGSPVKHLAGARVWLANDAGYVAQGRLTKVRLVKQRWAIDRAEVRVRQDWAGRRPAAGALYGGFAFRAPVWRAGRRLYTQAADDLAGVYAVVATATALARRRSPVPFLGLLTRAEEVGFVGAVGHFELGWSADARRPLLCISLEASRTLPGALVGKGPVVRLGDRRTVFHAGYLKVLSDLAERVLPGRHQRRIMDGGSCEATAATAFGLPAIGLSLPMGNYHNQGLEGGPDCRGPAGPAPEFVHLDDLAGELALCRALMRPGLPWHDPWGRQRQRLRANRRRYRRLAT